MIMNRYENLTPEKAQKWLATSLGNRKISNVVVSRYARDMVSGNWMLTGENIIFDCNGHMLNGHHRCLAVKESGVTIPVIVTRGIEPEAFKKMDNGMPRSAPHIAQILGQQNATVGTSSATLILLYERDKIKTYKTVRPDKSDCAEFMVNNPDIQHSIRQGYKTRHLGSIAVLTACHYLFSKINPTMADSLYESLSSGENLKKGSTEHKLREQLIRYRMNKHRVSNLLQMAIIIKAWNAIRNNKAVQVFSWRDNEEFPVAT
jgi:hypothetical protein